MAALLTRRSRIAAYAGIPAAFAGGQLAAFFLSQFVLYYHLVLPGSSYRRSPRAPPAYLVQWLPMSHELLLLSGRDGGR